MNLWHYNTETIYGDLRDAATFLNAEHPDWDVVTLSHVGAYTTIVYRVPAP